MSKLDETRALKRKAAVEDNKSVPVIEISDTDDDVVLICEERANNHAVGSTSATVPISTKTSKKYKAEKSKKKRLKKANKRKFGQNKTRVSKNAQFPAGSWAATSLPPESESPTNVLSQGNENPPKFFQSSGSDTTFISLAPGEKFPFIGHLKYHVILGGVEIFGYKTTVSSISSTAANDEFIWTPVVSLEPGPFLQFECVENETQRDISKEELRTALRQFCEDEETIGQILFHRRPFSCCVALRRAKPSNASMIFGREHFPKSKSSKTPGELRLFKDVFTYDATENSRPVVEFSTVQFECAQKIVSDAVYHINNNENYVVVVVGKKNVGKSTFARYLMNRLFSQNLPVSHLDCDVGQTEFTPPGCLALTKIDQPVFGPPYAHLKAPHKCIFFGETSAVNRMNEYTDAVENLVAEFRNLTADECGCLVVNTCGWIHGTGMDMLKKLCRFVNPNSVIFLRFQDDAHKSKLAYDDLKSVLSNQNASSFFYMNSSWADNIASPSYGRPRDNREAALLSYFGQMVPHEPLIKKEDFAEKICSKIPCVVPMKSVFVKIVHGVAPPTCILSILNAGVVALCRVENESSEQAKHWMDDRTLPTILNEHVANIHCLGFGIIRAIDVEARVFYVVSPLPQETLSTVNVFLKGDIALPNSVFTNASHCFDYEHVPYVAQENEILEQNFLGDRTTFERFNSSLTLRRQYRMRAGKT